LEENILNYFLQCTAYAEMFEELTDKRIDTLVVAIAVEGGQPQIFVRQKYMYRTQLLSFLANSPLTKIAK
jgi:hypothetical protein